MEVLSKPIYQYVLFYKGLMNIRLLDNVPCGIKKMRLLMNHNNVR